MGIKLGHRIRITRSIRDRWEAHHKSEKQRQIGPTAASRRQLTSVDVDASTSSRGHHSIFWKSIIAKFYVRFQAREEVIDRLWQANAHRIVKFAKICEMFENIIMIKFDTRHNFWEAMFPWMGSCFRNTSNRPPKFGRNLPEIETITVQIQINPLKLVRFSKFEEYHKIAGNCTQRLE